MQLDARLNKMKEKGPEQNRFLVIEVVHNYSHLEELEMIRVELGRERCSGVELF